MLLYQRIIEGDTVGVNGILRDNCFGGALFDATDELLLIGLPLIKALVALVAPV